MKGYRQIIRTCLFLSCLFALLNVEAQSPLYKNYNVQHGLPSSETYNVFQDSRGYIWIATDKGASRFDGYNFRIFSINEGVTDNTVFTVSEDQKGRIWFKTYTGGVCYYDYDSDKVVVPEENEALIKQLGGKVISNIVFDSQEMLWIGAYGSNAIYKMDLKNKNKGNGLYIDTSYGYPGPYLIEIDKKTPPLVGSLSQDKNIIYPELTIFSDKKKYSFAQLHKTPVTVPNRYVIRQAGGEFYLSHNNVIYHIRKDSILDHFDANKIINCLYRDSQGDMWIGRRGSGVVNLPKGDFSAVSKVFLKDYSVTSILEDKEGGYWFSTLEDGVFYMKNKIFVHYTAEDGISNQKVNCLAITPNNEILAATIDGKINFIHNDVIKQIDINAVNIMVNSINDIEIIDDHEVHVGGSGHIVLKDLKVNNMIRLNDEYLYFVSTILKSTMYPGKYWVGSETLFQMDKTGDKYKVTNLNFGKRITALCEDKDILWIGARNGLWSYENKIYHYHGDNELLSTRISDIKVDSLNNLWIATRGKGLVIKHNQKLLSISEKQGLASDVCQSVFLDSPNMALIGTNKGINKIVIKSWDPFEYNIETFNSKNGLISDEVNQVYKQGEMVYVATNKGITTFNINNITPNKIAPPVYITSLKINDKNRSLLPSYELPHDQNYITISFAGLTYKDAGNVKYKYRLSGVDSTWNYTTYTTINYTTLPEGEYTFEVFALNNDGMESALPAKVHFKITPPIWKTWWARSIAALIILVVVIVIFRWRIHDLKRTKKELVQTVKERTVEVIIQRDEAEKQKLLVEEKNKDIIDSINYGKRIQEALLKNVSSIAENLLSSFIIYKPKDIVSGDFYWGIEKLIHQQDKESAPSKLIYLAVADCTGHGVPGAFLTMLGTAYLNEITSSDKILSPAEILEQLRERFIKELGQTGKDFETRDGMDISLISLKFNLSDKMPEVKLEWAGANNPLWIAKNNSEYELKEIKPDKQPIGFTEILKPFTNHSVELNKGDTFYIFSDGYTDQFGGPNGKKFKYSGLKELIKSICNKPMDEQKNILLKNFEDWRGTLEQIDDVCIIGVRL